MFKIHPSEAFICSMPLEIAEEVTATALRATRAKNSQEQMEILLSVSFPTLMKVKRFIFLIIAETEELQFGATD